MNNRYPAPHADRMWSPEAKIDRWKQITDDYIEDAIEQDLLGYVPSFNGNSFREVRGLVPAPEPEFVQQAEREHGHEIVGFLDAYSVVLPFEFHPFMHYGLTSSDLTEYDLHRAASEHAGALQALVIQLRKAIEHRIIRHINVPRAGRTHGQTAETTNLGHQFGVFHDAINNLDADLAIWAVQYPVKSPGPTGVSAVGRERNRATPSTQVIHRDYLLSWACLYLRLGNILDSIATFVRLGARSEIGELSEGAAKARVGSSAMPGKRNPIDSERVSGLARVVRGSFLALSEVSNLWEDRDLSNSSTERIEVPQLAATVEYMTRTMTEVLRNLQVDTDRIAQNLTDPRTRANLLQCEIQKTQRVGPLEASRIAANRMKEKT